MSLSATVAAAGAVAAAAKGACGVAAATTGTAKFLGTKGDALGDSVDLCATGMEGCNGTHESVAAAAGGTPKTTVPCALTIPLPDMI